MKSLRPWILSTVLLAGVASWWLWPASKATGAAALDDCASSEVRDPVTGNCATPAAQVTTTTPIRSGGTEFTHSDLPVSQRRTSVPPPLPTSAGASNPATLPAPPPPTAPLAQALPALEARANAGDREAASRLAQDAACCAALDLMAGSLDRLRQLPPGQESPIPERQRQFIATAESQLVALNAHCGAVPPLPPSKVFDYTLRAAELGDPVATLDLVGNRQIMGMLQSQAVAEYERVGRFRERALPLLMEQVRQGNLDAVRTLAAAHATPAMHGALGGLVEQDQIISLVYDLVYLQAGGQAYRPSFEGFVQRRRNELTPAQFSDAQAQADRLYRAHFAGKTPRESSYPQLIGLSPDPKFKEPPALAAQRRTCPRPQFTGAPGMFPGR